MVPVLTISGAGGSPPVTGLVAGELCAHLSGASRRQLHLGIPTTRRRSPIRCGSREANPPHPSRAWTAPERVSRWKNPLATNENSIAEGKKLYAQECLICHGPEGKGDGRVARILDVSPADLSDTNLWQQTDRTLRWKISEGRVEMPSFRMRFSRHEVRLPVNYVRTLAPRATVEPNREASNPH